jgi:DNA-binding response OmpR family regulator
MTALTMKGDRERCLAAGMDGYVLKPIRTKELFSAIDDVIAASQPAGPAEQQMQPAESKLHSGPLISGPKAGLG